MMEVTIALKEYLYNIGIEKDADFLRQTARRIPQLIESK
jgi:hypothetical protein